MRNVAAAGVISPNGMLLFELELGEVEHSSIIPADVSPATSLRTEQATPVLPRRVVFGRGCLAAAMEAAMSDIDNNISQTGEAAQHDSQRDDAALPTGSGLHPRVYTIIIGLAVWFVLAVWIFAGAGVTDYLLFIVNGFIFVSIALPLILAAVGSNDKLPNGEPAERPPAKQQSFHDWVAGSFGIWGGRLSGKEAMVQVLLPFAAVAFGMTIFGVIFHIAERGGV